MSVIDFARTWAAASSMRAILISDLGDGHRRQRPTWLNGDVQGGRTSGLDERAVGHRDRLHHPAPADECGGRIGTRA